jgi:hypothetical protein
LPQVLITFVQSKRFNAVQFGAAEQLTLFRIELNKAVELFMPFTLEFPELNFDSKLLFKAVEFVSPIGVTITLV